jgi:hypothetical protein
VAGLSVAQLYFCFVRSKLLVYLIDASGFASDVKKNCVGCIIIIIIIIIFLCRVFTIICLKRTMSLGNTVLQLFRSYD